MALTNLPNSVTASDFQKLKDDVDALAALANANKAAIALLVTLGNELKTDMSAHVHGGVTAGSADTSAGATIAAADAVAVTVADVTVKTE